MMSHKQRCESTGGADEPTVPGTPQPRTDVEVRNTAVVTVGTGVVQAGTITGGVHYHQLPAVPVGPVPQQLRPAPHGFIGRVDHLADLGRLVPTILDTPSDEGHGAAMVVISAISGAGGIGKTWLALTWAHRNLYRFPGGQLFADLHGFSPAGRPAQPTDVLGGFLEALGVNRDRHPTDPDRRAELYRTLMADKRMLVVLDNAATADQVTPLLPGGRHCTVLITSRNQLPGLVARHGARPIHLDVLADAEAHALLATALGPERTANDAPAIAELIKLCNGFPLALGVIAARAATNPQLPLGDIVADLRARGLDALESEDPTASLPSVLSWSLRHLTIAQREVFALLGAAPGPDIGLPAAAALTDLPERETYAVLQALADASLIDRTPGGRYAMHDLVSAYATSVAADLSDAAREAALRRVLDFYTHTTHTAHQLIDPRDDPIQLDPLAPNVHSHPLFDAPVALAWCDREHACLLAAQHTATTLAWHPTVWHIAWALDAFHYRRGHLHDRLAVWQAAADAATHLPDPTSRALAYRFLGVAHAELGQHQDAVQHLHQALTLAEHNHDPLQQARAHHKLGWVWGHRGDDRQALEHARRALNLYRVLDKPVWEAQALNAVGWYAARLGDYDTAREHCHASLGQHRRHHNPEGEAATLDSLGYIEHHSGRHAEAIDHYRQALTLRRDHGNTYEAAGTLDRLGHPHAALSQHEQARTVWQEALKLYQAQDRHNDAARVRRHLEAVDHDSDQPSQDTEPTT